MARRASHHSARQKQIQYLNRGRKGEIGVLATKFSAPGFRHRTCQFIEGDPSPDESCKCGAPVVPGTAYCAHHLERTRSHQDAAEADDEDDVDEPNASAAA